MPFEPPNEPSRKLVIGAGDTLDIACAAWQSAAPELRVERIEVLQDRAYHFDLGFLDGLAPGDVTLFAAFDDRFLNFKRLELLSLLRLRGYRLPPCIAPGAVIAPDAKIGENAFVGAGAVLGARAQVEYNAVIAAGCRIGFESRIGHSAWLEAGAIVGDRAEIGAHTSIGSGALVGRGVKVGKLCELRVPRLYGEDVPAKTYYSPHYLQPLRIFN